VTAAALAWAQAREGRQARPTRTPLLIMFVAWCGRHLPSVAKARSAVMQTSAFASLTYAAFQWDTIAGFVAVGVSLLVLEALISADTPRGGRR
jgi:uncharacterized membrane protein